MIHLYFQTKSSGSFLKECTEHFEQHSFDSETVLVAVKPSERTSPVIWEGKRWKLLLPSSSFREDLQDGGADWGGGGGRSGSAVSVGVRGASLEQLHLQLHRSTGICCTTEKPSPNQVRSVGFDWCGLSASQTQAQRRLWLSRWDAVDAPLQIFFQQNLLNALMTAGLKSSFKTRSPLQRITCTFPW